MSESVRAFIGIGSNIDPLHYIPAALALLAEFGQITGISSFYWTDPIGRPEQDRYLNGVVGFVSGYRPWSLKMDVLRHIEDRLGRQRCADPYAARCIDLDLLLWGDSVLSEPDVLLPDPDILERPFLLAGLLELEEGLILPDTGKPLADMNNDATAALERDSAFTQQLRERFTTQ